MAEIVNFFGEPDQGQVNAIHAICDAATVMRNMIDEHCPESYEAEQAMIRLQEALMWANSAIIG